MTPSGTFVSVEDPIITFALPYNPFKLRPSGNVTAKSEKVLPTSAAQVESRVYVVPVSVQVVQVLSSTYVYSKVVLNAQFIS
jgi:hypothetical protein